MSVTANLQTFKLNSYANLLRRMQKDSEAVYAANGSNLAKGRSQAFSLLLSHLKTEDAAAFIQILQSLLVDAEEALSSKADRIAQGVVMALQTALNSLACLGIPSYPDVPAITDGDPLIVHNPEPRETSQAYKLFIYQMEEGRA